MTLQDPRVVRIPFMTRRPTFSETQRIAQQLSQLTYQDPPSLTEPTVSTNNEHTHKKPHQAARHRALDDSEYASGRPPPLVDFRFPGYCYRNGGSTNRR